MNPLAWFMVLMISERLPPLVVDMPSREVCQQVLTLNSEFHAHCWAKEKLGESVEPPPAIKPPAEQEDDPL
jgi:hypothetical protein